MTARGNRATRKQRSRGRSTALLAAVSALCLIGCGGSSGAASSDSSGSSGETQLFAASTPNTDLLAKIAASPQRAKFRGMRVYRLLHDDPATPETSYREDVASDGAGRFALELVDWLAPALTPSQEALTEQLVAYRAALFYRYRGFAIRHLPTFLSNYVVADTGATQGVAGVTGMRLTVDPADLQPPSSPSFPSSPSSTGRSWEIVVDPNTGLVLDAQEFDSDGSLRSHLYFETLDLNPDLSGIAWHLSGNQEVVVPKAQAASAFDWPLLIPALLPAGYIESELASVSMLGQEWAKHTLTNGLDVVFFLEREPSAPAPGGIVPTADEVLSFQIDSMNVLDGNVQGHRIIAAGPTSELELAGMIQSAIE